MTPTLRRKLEALAERREELERLLADPDVIGDGDRFRAFSREFAQLEPLATAMAEEKRARADLTAAQAMREDPELAELADEEITAAQQRLAQLDEQLMLLLLPKDSRDEGNLFLEVRAGTGGDEAAIFAGDLFRMYARYAERQGWKVEIESDSPGEHGGYKEIVARIVGRGAYSKLSSSRAPTACSACRKPNRRAASIPRPPRWRSSRTWTTWTRSSSTRPT